MLIQAIVLGLIIYVTVLAWPFVLGALVLLIIWRIVFWIKDKIDSFIWRLGEPERHAKWEAHLKDLEKKGDIERIKNQKRWDFYFTVEGDNSSTLNQELILEDILAGKHDDQIPSLHTLSNTK